MISSLLVALQFGLAAALIVTVAPLGTPLANGAVFVLVTVGTFVGVAALAVNRPGNFNVRPEPKAGARLVTDGIYRHIRHPMYCAFLLVVGAAVVADPRPWRCALWLALVAVLLVKMQREEQHLRAAFAPYAAYAARTRRLIPGIY
jgi:protein-S-isoprenylcysteine O-methyltransferase Ste14